MSFAKYNNNLVNFKKKIQCCYNNKHTSLNILVHHTSIMSINVVISTFFSREHSFQKKKSISVYLSKCSPEKLWEMTVLLANYMNHLEGLISTSTFLSFLRWVIVLYKYALFNKHGNTTLLNVQEAKVLNIWNSLHMFHQV